MVTASVATVLVAIAIIVLWRLIGPTGFIFAWITHFLLMAWISTISEGVAVRLDQPWFRVRRWEPALYRRVGVPLYGRILDRIGWNRSIERIRDFDGTRAGLPGLDQHTRRSEAGHLACAVVTALLAIAVVAGGSWSGAWWLVGLGVVLHVYPIALQRQLRARLRFIMDR